MVNPIDLATALLVIFVRRFLRRLPFVQASILSTTTPQVSLYRPISFIAGGFIYFITKNKHHEWLQIAREFTRRRLSRHSNLDITHSEHSHHRVNDRIEKAKNWSGENFQGNQELQRKSKIYVENYCKANKIPLMIDNHAVSRFVPTPKTRNSKTDDVTYITPDDPIEVSSAVNFIHPSTSKVSDPGPSMSEVAHTRTKPSKRDNICEPVNLSKHYRKLQIQEDLNLESTSKMLKRRHTVPHDTLSDVKRQRHRRKRVVNAKVVKTSSPLNTNSETILMDLGENTDKLPAFIPPQNDGGGVGDASCELELIRTTRSGKIYGYKEIIKGRRRIRFQR